MRTALAIVVGLGLIGPSSSVQAQDQPKREKRKLDVQAFERLDANKDGVLTLDEIPKKRQEGAEKVFDRMDKDGDKKLTREELVAAKRSRPRGQLAQRPGGPERPEGAPPQGERRPGEPGRPGQPGQGQPPFPGPGDRPPMGLGGPDLFRALDTNRDAKLSREELAKAVEMLMKFDRDGDGALTPAEVAEGIRASRPEAGPTPPAPPGSGAADFVDNMIRRADKDNDGKLSRDELPELMRPRFETIDENKDGYIDRDELKKAGERMRRERREAGNPPELPGRPGAPGQPRLEVLAANRERVANFLREHDKDADGRVSLEEFGSGREGEFKSLDANADGFLSPPELARGLAPQEDRPEGRRRPNGPDRGGEKPNEKEKP